MASLLHENEVEASSQSTATQAWCQPSYHRISLPLQTPYLTLPLLLGIHPFRLIARFILSYASDIHIMESNVRRLLLAGIKVTLLNCLYRFLVFPVEVYIGLDNLYACCSCDPILTFAP